MSTPLSWGGELNIRVNQRHLRETEHFLAFKILKKKKLKSVAMAIVSGSNMSLWQSGTALTREQDVKPITEDPVFPVATGEGRDGCKCGLASSLVWR